MSETGDFSPRTLPAAAAAPSRAEHVFLRLARRWHEAFAAVAKDEAPPRAVDELALAAASLACEHGAAFTTRAWQQAEVNITLAGTRGVAWIDRLPWRVASAARLEELERSWELEELYDNLDHHNSALRT